MVEPANCTLGDFENMMLGKIFYFVNNFVDRMNDITYFEQSDTESCMMLGKNINK